MKRSGIQGMDWRWWVGGGVTGVALVLGCASAVDFRESGREAGTRLKPHGHLHVEKEKPFTRGLATEPGDEPMHNDGKVRMPISVSVDGDTEIVLSRDTNVIITIMAESDIKRLQGHIQGADGLESFQGINIDIPEIAAGASHLMELTVPAKNGSLYFRLVGDVGENTMASAYEIKVKNPKEVRAASKPNPAEDLRAPVETDTTGLVVQPMKGK
ncbi:MAG: hypothetical protein J0L82_11540 [Deltaproteobacteria bacterium]|nr:hypothetical protein [Deltaproteobacteria bacterium]